MYYADLKKYDIANGPGVRVSLFVSGCPHACPGCFNEIAWDYQYGSLYTKEVEEEVLASLQPTYIKGLTLLGGEPLAPLNQKTVCSLVKKVKEVYPEKSIWCYTGYLFDKEILEEMVPNSEELKELLAYLDVIVDGRFVSSLSHKGLVFRGSSNQRIIDVQESLKKKKIVEIPVEDKTFQGINRKKDEKDET